MSQESMVTKYALRVVMSKRCDKIITNVAKQSSEDLVPAQFMTWVIREETSHDNKLKPWKANVATDAAKSRSKVADQAKVSDSIPY